VPKRFALYADADVRGPVVKALRQAGWDVVRAIDLYPEGTPDPVHFDHAAREGRVMIVHDIDQVICANERLDKQLPCPPLVVWAQKSYTKATVGAFVAAIEELASREQPFNPDYPIVYITVRR